MSANPRQHVIPISGGIRHTREEVQGWLASGERSARLYLALAQIQIEDHKFEEAAESYRQLLRLDPSHRAARLNLAICLEKLNRWAEAAQNFEKSLEVDPAREEARLGLGICYLHLRRPEQAITLFDQTLENAPADQVALIGKAVALQLLGRDEEAAEYHRRAAGQIAASPGESAPSPRPPEIAADPEGRRVQERGPLVDEGLAAAALAAGDFRAVIRHCSRIVQSSPEHFEAWCNLGVARQQVGETEDAVFAYKQAVKVRPDAWQPWLNLGLLRHAGGDADGAREAYQECLQRAPDAGAARWNLALLLEQQERLEEAGQQFARLVEGDPAHLDAWFRLGLVRSALTEWSAAAEAFEQCVAQRRGWTEAWLNLGAAARQANDPRRAQEAFEAAVENNPPAPLLADALRGMTALAVARDDWARAALLHRRLQASGETAPDLAFRLARHHEEAGDAEEAIRLYCAAVKERPDYADALARLGHLLAEQGRYDEALECWKHALQFDPSIAQGYFEGGE